MAPNQSHQRAAKGQSHARDPRFDEGSFAAWPVGTNTPSLTEGTQLILDPHDVASQYVHQDTSNIELPQYNAQGVYRYSASDLNDPLTSTWNHMDQQGTSVNHHLQEHPQGNHPYGNSDVAYQGTPTVDHHQGSTQGTYQFVTRPWQHRNNNPGHATTDTMSTMERWENETIREQPWHGVDSVYVVDAGMEHGDSQADGAQDNLECQTEGVDSMACEGSSEMWWA
jgi:hypothetical protein